MQLTKIEKNGIACAVVNSNEIVITDAQSALDALMSAKYDIGTKNIVVDKKLITEDFFILSKGLAGEILQKYVNYGGRIAIYGDYSHYFLPSFLELKSSSIRFFQFVPSGTLHRTAETASLRTS